MSKMSNVVDLTPISNRPPPAKPSAEEEKGVEKPLSTDEEDEIVYNRVLKRKRESLEGSKKTETDEKAEAIRKGIERRKKIMKIKNWCAGFRDVLEDFIKSKNLEKMSDAELDATMEECRFIVSARNTGLVTDQSAVSIVDWIEDGLTQHTSLKVAGPKVSLKQLAASKDCTDLIKELSLEYMDFVYQRPEWRALLFLVNGVYAIHSINKDAAEAGPKTVAPSEAPVEPAAKRARVENEPGKDKDGYELPKVA